MYSQYLCGVPSERLNGMPRLPRVAPWAGMRRPVGALAEMPPLTIKNQQNLGLNEVPHASVIIRAPSCPR